MSGNGGGEDSTQVAEDLVTEAPLRRLAATLDLDGSAWSPSDDVPALWHWLFFTPVAQHRDIDRDGHPKRGGLLQDALPPRRMWAGGRIDFVAPMYVGQQIERQSRVDAAQHKSGRSGRMVFFTVNHEIRREDQLLVREAQDIVYREAAVPGAPAPVGTPAVRESDLERIVVPDAVMLFRYSALTFNGHRIHYDRDYCRDVEQYPGLVVHGPLVATLLMDLLHRGWPELHVRRFDFKAVSPLFEGEPIILRARHAEESRIELWAANEAGRLAMSAAAEVVHP